MKTQAAIRQRLLKLRFRYLKNYLKQTQEKVHSNCVHNIEHKPRRLTTHPVDDELNISPRKTNSLVVIQSNAPPNSVHICGYGLCGGWNGDICDKSNDVARTCSHFTYRVSADDAERRFNELMQDDEYVMKHYPDIAALQWALNVRAYHYRLRWYERVIFFFRQLFLGYGHGVPTKLLTDGVPDPGEDPPESLWR